MPDDLYHRDILAWSKAQAERLRRVAAGERVEDVDWPNVIEEIESVGHFILAEAQSRFFRAMIEALKATAWPEHAERQEWCCKAAGMLGDARIWAEPAMASHLDAAALYDDALRVVREMRMDAPPIPLHDRIALTGADLLDDDFGAADLLARIRAAAPAA